MSQLLLLLYNRWKSYAPAVYGTVIVVAVLAVLYYAYKYVYLPKKDSAKFADVANASPTSDEIVVYMFHVDWCPHCKKAEPEWEKFSSAYHEKPLNGYRIICKSIDCTNKDDTQVQSILDKYNVRQYPTVIAVYSGTETRVDFEAKVKKEHLDKFVHSLTTRYQ